ncbi:hypothetical protein HK102_008356, partial [Quaeritorhiza haematococci]
MLGTNSSQNHLVLAITPEAPSTSFIQGFNGLGPCHLSGLIRLTYPGSQPIQIEHLKVTIKGYSSARLLLAGVDGGDTWNIAEKVHLRQSKWLVLPPRKRPPGAAAAVGDPRKTTGEEGEPVYVQPTQWSVLVRPRSQLEFRFMLLLPQDPPLPPSVTAQDARGGFQVLVKYELQVRLLVKPVGSGGPVPTISAKGDSSSSTDMGTTMQGGTLTVPSVGDIKKKFPIKIPRYDRDTLAKMLGTTDEPLSWSCSATASSSSSTSDASIAETSSILSSSSRSLTTITGLLGSALARITPPPSPSPALSQPDTSPEDTPTEPSPDESASTSSPPPLQRENSISSSIKSTFASVRHAGGKGFIVDRLRRIRTGVGRAGSGSGSGGDGDSG